MNTKNQTKPRWSLAVAALALLAMSAVSSAQSTDATLSSLESSSNGFTPAFVSAMPRLAENLILLKPFPIK